MTHTYHLEIPYLETWRKFEEGPKSYCDGYMDAMTGQHPGIHLRMMRSDGKITREIKANDDVCIGMVAGWPTAEQYERAAEAALERARKIRENQANKTTRHP
jgi:hypothetical protein